MNAKPCPFCGAEAEQYLPGLDFWRCPDRCGQMLAMNLKKWNRRPIESALEAEIERLKAENVKLEIDHVFNG